MTTEVARGPARPRPARNTAAQTWNHGPCPSGPAVVSAAQSAGSPVVIDCDRAARVRPSEFVLTCADYGDFLDRLHWVSWGPAAFGSGTEWIHDCVPSCVSNRTFRAFPVLVVLWRPQPWPGHRGRSYFTRLTEIYPGQRPRYQVPHGQSYPQAVTWDLSDQI
jgi:hypothetical protein